MRQEVDGLPGPMLPPPPVSSVWPGLGNLRHLPKYWDSRRATFWKNRERDFTNVVFFGDSIIEKWSRHLHTDFRGIQVANRGICGDTTRGLLFRMSEDVFAIFPRALVLLIGVNDLDVKSQPSDIALNIKEICKQFKDVSDGPCIVSTALPHRDMEDKPLRIRELNKEIFEKLDGMSRVSVVNVYSLLVDGAERFNQKLFVDAVHPNRLGYQVISLALNPILRFRLENKK